MASLKKVLKKKKYLKVKLKKIATNHLELKATINGVKGRFILDTGASNSCVGLDLIEYFQLISEDSEIKAAGAGAMNMETKKSSNNILRIGKWKMRTCDLVLFDLSHVNTALTQHNAKEVHGIIGADVLESGKAFIDYQKNIYTLKDTREKRLYDYLFKFTAK
ncbi:retropepsin-like aspartic protease [Tenacibaculum sp. SG-28]|uniref:retropepsin-like aspartic protease n=1 Tax=Tenacibaculum sp. SG-28 TaxID=754426 RepID=UPI000CF50F2C|nr:retropepsin-like aspartic protease [Tenacibaculum sp. SG-28]PQJ21669.1 acid protease [Tenacibaculum sp. SG-28]